MSMTARFWSISALAVELGMDRRTMAARLRDVPPDGTLKGHPAWRLQTALRAIGGRVPPAPMIPPFGAEVLAAIPNKIHAAMVAGVLTCVYATPRLVRHLAMQAGGTAEAAGELAGLATIALAGHCEQQFRAMKLPPFQADEPAWLNIEAMEWRPEQDDCDAGAAA